MRALRKGLLPAVGALLLWGRGAAALPATPVASPTPVPKGATPTKATIKAVRPLPPASRATPLPKAAASPSPLPASPAPARIAADGALPSWQTAPTGLHPAEMPSSGGVQVSEEAQRLARIAGGEFEKGDLAAAQRDFEKVLTLVPGNPAATINLGLIAYRQHRLPESETLLRQVVKNNAEAGLAWLILGIVYYEEEKLEAALAALAQAVYLEPKDARAHHYLGVILGRRGWLSGAEDEMRRALELQPNYPEAHFNLAVFYLQRNPPALELARRHYQRARDLGAAPDPQVAKLLEAP